MIPHLSIEQALGLVVSGHDIALIIAALPLTITAIASLIVSIRNGGKADSIAKLVDGNTSKLQTDLATANGMIQQLIRFYPSVTAPATETAKVEIVQPENKPVPTKVIKP